MLARRIGIEPGPGRLVAAGGTAPALPGWAAVPIQTASEAPSRHRIATDSLPLAHLAAPDPSTRDATATKNRETFKGRLEVAPNIVEFLELEAMLRKIGMETEMKEKRFLDERPKA